MNWSDLSDKDKKAIEKAYRAGKEPGEIAPSYGLKPKQVSDQAYRKKWSKPAGAKKKAGKKAKKKVAKKTKKKAAKKKTAKKAKKKVTKKKKR